MGKRTWIQGVALGLVMVSSPVMAQLSMMESEKTLIGFVVALIGIIYLLHRREMEQLQKSIQLMSSGTEQKMASALDSVLTSLKEFRKDYREDNEKLHGRISHTHSEIVRVEKDAIRNYVQRSELHGILKEKIR